MNALYESTGEREFIDRAERPLRAEIKEIAAKLSELELQKKIEEEKKKGAAG